MNPRQLPPVPQQLLKDPVLVQFLEKMRASIVDIQTDSSGISGSPPYISQSGGTMSGDLTLQTLAGNPDKLLAVNAVGKISVTNQTPSDINLNAFNIAKNTADIVAIENDVTNIENNITGLQAISGNHEVRIVALENYDHSIYSLSSTVASISGNLQSQITSNDGDISVLQSNITGLQTISGSQDIRITNLENYDHSVYALTTDVASISADLQGQIISNNNDITGLQAISGDLQGHIWDNDTDIFNLRTDVNTVSGNVTNLQTYTSGISGGLTQLDSRYVNISGDTMSGPLVINGSDDYILDVFNSSSSARDSFRISNPTHALTLGTVSQFLVMDTEGTNAIIDIRRAGTSRLTFSGANALFNSSVTKVEIQGTDDSTSLTTGVLQVKGGASIAKSLTVGGMFNLDDVTFTNTISGGSFSASGDFLKIITPSGDRFINLYEV